MGTFTFNGQLLHPDGATPIVAAPVSISAPAYPDSIANVVYTAGLSTVTDPNGRFSVTLVAQPDITYTLTCDQAAFGTVRFASANSGDTLDLSDVVPFQADNVLTGSVIDGGTP